MTVYTWTGAIDGNTNTAGNWSPAAVPTSSDDVLFDAANNAVACIWQLSDITNFTFEGGVPVEFDATTINISGVMTISSPIEIFSSRAAVEFNFTGSSSVLIKYEGSDPDIWSTTDKAKATFHIKGTANNIMFENGIYPIVKIGSGITVSPHVPSAPNNNYTETDFYELTFESTGKFAETSAVIYSSDPKEERKKVFRIRSIGTWSPQRFEGGKAIWLFYATTAGFELPLTGSNLSTATSFEGKVAQIRVIATSYGQKIKIPPGPHYLEKLTIDTGVMCICDRGIAELLMTNRPTIDGAWQFVQITDGIYRSAKEDMILPITHGGTGENDAQSAINSLSQVSSATNEHVLTKDTTTGNAIWKAGGAGAVGPAGPAGPTGPQGPAGADGTDGADGVDGTDGADGTDGVDGATGPAGATGPTGPAGADGNDGATGPQGPAGNDGADGGIGPVGPQGPAGADGTDGSDGAQGPTGATGPAGADGADGTNGTNGSDGADGADGATGATGPAGATGPQGPTGPAGADGADGADGSDGATGPTGPTGPQGPAGVSAPTGQYQRFTLMGSTGTLAAGTTTQLTFGTTGAVLVAQYTPAPTDFIEDPINNNHLVINADGLYQFTFCAFLAALTSGNPDYRVTISSTSSLTGDILSFRNRTSKIDRHTGSATATVYLTAASTVYFSVRCDGANYLLAGIIATPAPGEIRTFLDVRRLE